jgi:hypothetical protein
LQIGKKRGGKGVVVLGEEGGRKTSRSSSLQKGAWYSLWAQAAERRVVHFEKGTEGLVRRRTIVWARFVRLHGAHAFPEQ